MCGGASGWFSRAHTRLCDGSALVVWPVMPCLSRPCTGSGAGSGVSLLLTLVVAFFRVGRSGRAMVVRPCGESALVPAAVAAAAGCTPSLGSSPRAVGTQHPRSCTTFAGCVAAVALLLVGGRSPRAPRWRGSVAVVMSATQRPDVPSVPAAGAGCIDGVASAPTCTKAAAAIV